MKIRNGFVSNSSSSSFVVLGVKYSKSDAADLANKHKLHMIDDADIIGIHYFSASDDGDIDESTMTPEDIKKDFDKLKAIFGEDAEIKWFSGMDYC